MSFNDFHLIIEQSGDLKPKLDKTIDYLQQKDNVLLLTTSNRWDGYPDDIPKSTALALEIQSQLGKQKCSLIEIPKVKIYTCEGNVSSDKGNNCGVKGSVLKEKVKNPSGYHRCWASINNKDDQLWKVSRALFECDVCVFFGSIRWGQANAQYQKLIERLTWIENRHVTLLESNILESKGTECGCIFIGQNWRGSDVVKVQKEVLEFFGFTSIKELCWNWQYSQNENEESKSGYKKARKVFEDTFDIKLSKPEK